MIHSCFREIKDLNAVVTEAGNENADMIGINGKMIETPLYIWCREHFDQL